MHKRLRSWCERLARDTGASEIAEAALVLPLVFMFLLAILMFGRAYNIYTTITHAAQEGARTATSTTCATCGNTAATTTQVAAAVSQVLQASKINPAAIQTYTGPSARIPCPTAPPACPTGESGAGCCGASGRVSVCTNVEVNAPGGTVTGPTACGTIVSFQYPYQFTLPFTSLNKQIVVLKADVQMEAEN